MGISLSTSSTLRALSDMAGHSEGTFRSCIVGSSSGAIRQRHCLCGLSGNRLWHVRCRITGRPCNCPELGLFVRGWNHTGGSSRRGRLFRGGTRCPWHDSIFPRHRPRNSNGHPCFLSGNGRLAVLKYHFGNAARRFPILSGYLRLVRGSGRGQILYMNL